MYIGRALARNAVLGATAAVVAGYAAANAQSPSPGSAPAAMAASGTTVPQAEVSDTATMPAATPRWVYMSGGYGTAGTSIYDADTGKMKGQVEVPSLGNLSLDPKGRYYYVAETIWTKIDRGVRQDMVTLWDAASLKWVSDIPIPGRLLGGTALSNFTVSSDGALGYVYTLQPSSSVQVVDLQGHKLLQTVQLPGCAAVFPSGLQDASALCANGSLATISISGGKGRVSHTAPFFSPGEDPVFDLVAMDRSKNTALFISYTGKVYTAALGDSPRFAPPWSLQVAAGMREAVNKPLDVSWLPGGRQPFAINRVTGRLYVLMHMGEQWSQKAPGEEVWVVDVATHKVIARHPLESKISGIQVSQEAQPLLYLDAPDSKLLIVDEATFEIKHTIEHAGGSMTVIEPS